MTPILELKNIDYSYHTLDGETKALSNISFSLTKGEFTAVVGPSGCGKSTLLSLIDGLMKPEIGELLMNGDPLTENSSKIGYMLQHDHLFEWRTVYRNVLLGAEISRQLTPEIKKRAEEMLEQYGLKQFARSKPLNCPAACARGRRLSEPSFWNRNCCCLTSHSLHLTIRLD